MTEAIVFVGIMLLVVGVCGWCYAWSAISDWVEEKTDSEALAMFVLFTGGFGLPIALLCAAIVGSMP